MEQAEKQQPNYVFTEDRIFDITQHSIAVNQDVINKSCNKYVGANCSSISGLNGSRSTITISADQVSKLQWQNLALEMQIVIGETATTKALNVAPPWNLPFHLIRSINVKLNDSYTYSIPSDYAYVATASLLQYPQEYVENAEFMLFTPCFDAVNDKYVSYLTTAAAEAVATNYDKTSFQQRMNKYVNGYDGSTTAANFTSSAHPYRKIIPFNHLLFNLGNSVINNLQKVQIDIDWAPVDANLLERATTVSGALANNSKGNAYVMSCAVLTDSLNMSPVQMSQELRSKRAFKSDNVAFLKPQVFVKDFSKDKTEVINNVKNLSHVVVMQFPTGNTISSNATTPANKRTYNSGGQTFLIGNGTVHATPEIAAVADVATPLPDFRYSRDFVSGFQMQYGNALYPNHTITSTDGTHFDSSELYYEYLKCYDYLNGNAGRPFISKDVFDKVFPFICVKPFHSSGPFQATPSSDIILRFNGGSDTTTGKYAVILYTLETLKVNADKSITPFGIPN